MSVPPYGASKRGKVTFFPNANDYNGSWSWEVGQPARSELPTVPSSYAQEFDYGDYPNYRKNTEAIAHPIFAKVELYDRPILNRDASVRNWKRIWNTPGSIGKLDDNLATKCIIPDGVRSIDNQNLDCWVYDKNMTNKNQDDAMFSETNWNVFCQMGDFMLTDPNCDTKPSPTAKDYAMERICNKRKGIDDIMKGTKAGKDYVLEPKCSEWCRTRDPATNKIIHNCDIGGNHYCSDLNNFPEAASFCKDIWSRKFEMEEKTSAEKSCKNALLYSFDQGVFTNNGCGDLCNSNGDPGIDGTGDGKDVDFGWCNDNRGEYCSDPNNMFTDDCHDFCKNQPSYCENTLKNMCSQENTLGKPSSDTSPLTSSQYTIIKNKMNTKIPGTNHQWSDWCGCQQSSEFYNMWKAEEYPKWLEQGIDPEIALPRTEIECTYPYCKPSIKSQVQSKTPCPKCSQINFNDWKGAITTNTVIDAGQKLDCSEVAENIENILTENNTTNTNTTNTDTSSDTDFTKVDVNNPGAIAGIVIAGLVVLISFILLMYYKPWNRK